MARCYYVSIDPHYDIEEMAKIKDFVYKEISKYVKIIKDERGNNILYLKKVKKQTFQERITKENTDVFPIIVKEDSNNNLVDVLTGFRYKTFNNPKELTFLTLRLRITEEILSSDAIRLINSLDNDEKEAYRNKLYKFGLAVNKAYRNILDLDKKDLIENHFNIKQRIKTK